MPLKRYSTSNPQPTQEEFIHEFRSAFSKAKNILVVAGAGLSAASGIPTFRDGGGMWRSLDALSLATPRAFKKNPSLVWQFYNYRRRVALKAQPNAAHELIAKLSMPEHRQTVAPSSDSFHLITQNVDMLSYRCLQKISQETNDLSIMDTIFQMHGKLFEIQCTECEWKQDNFSHTLSPGLVEEQDNVQEAGTRIQDIALDQLPSCPSCGALARPGVVWFGEVPYFLEEIDEIVYEADMCLVVGTSATVYPAASYAQHVKRHNGIVAVFNMAPAENDDKADYIFQGGCEEILPRIFPELAAL